MNNLAIAFHKEKNIEEETKELRNSFTKNLLLTIFIGNNKAYY